MSESMLLTPTLDPEITAAATHVLDQEFAPQTPAPEVSPTAIGIGAIAMKIVESPVGTATPTSIGLSHLYLKKEGSQKGELMQVGKVLHEGTVASASQWWAEAQARKSVLEQKQLVTQQQEHLQFDLLARDQAKKSKVEEETTNKKKHPAPLAFAPKTQRTRKNFRLAA